MSMITMANLGARTIMKNKFYILVFLVATLCATPRMYEGPKLPKEQVATLEGSATK
jgi:hypothetical protein